MRLEWKRTVSLSTPESRSFARVPRSPFVPGSGKAMLTVGESSSPLVWRKAAKR